MKLNNPFSSTLACACAVIGLAVSTVSCEKGAGDKAEDAVEEATDEVGDAVEETAEDVEDAAN